MTTSMHAIMAIVVACMVASCTATPTEKDALFNSIEKLTEAGERALQQNDLAEAEELYTIIATNQPTEEHWLKLASIQTAQGKSVHRQRR